MIHFSAETPLFKLETPFVARLTVLLNKMLLKNKPATGEVNIIIASDHLLHDLNLQYRKKDAPTDVLCFVYGDEEELAFEENPVLGDIFISYERAAGQALEAGHSLEREIAFLCVHGLLHLLGFDHIEEADQKVMQQEEKFWMENFDEAADGSVADEQGSLQS